MDPVRDEAVGPAGPTTATRMDKFTRQMLEQTGLLGMVGKAERGPVAIEAIKDNKAVYLMAVGGAAYLVSKAIKKSTTLAFADLGMEAIYEFEVEDMPVTVAVDSNGTSVHETGPREWKERIAELPGNRLDRYRQRGGAIAAPPHFFASTTSLRFARSCSRRISFRGTIVPASCLPSAPALVRREEALCPGIAR